MANLMNLNEKYPVERSRLLDVFDFSQYTPDEMLLLDVYLSKINPTDPNSKRVQFRKKEYEIFLERGQQKTTAFKKAALGLFSKYIDPEHLPEDIEFDPKHIWEELSFKKDKETHEWVFTMECAKKTEPFFFNTQKYGFIRYLVGYTKNFTSKHSFILYYYLKRKRQEEIRYGNPIKPTVEELKKLTGAGRKKTYDEFRYFKRDVIDKAINEINCFTDIEVTYKTIKRGRPVERIHFNVMEKTSPPLLQDTNLEPSEELKKMFEEELKELKDPAKLPAAPEKVKVTLLDGREAWVEKSLLYSAEDENCYDINAGLEQQLEELNRKKSEEAGSFAPDLTSRKKIIKADEYVTDFSINPLELSFEDETDRIDYIDRYVDLNIKDELCRDFLLSEVPEEIHKYNETNLEAIATVAKRYVRYSQTFEMHHSHRMLDWNTKISNAVGAYTRQKWLPKHQHNVKEDAFAYYLSCLEYWLMDNYEQD